MSTAESKEVLRHKYKALRLKALPKEEANIIKQVIKTLERELILDNLNGYLGLYWPLKGEIDLRPLRHQYKFRIALPKTNQDGNLSYHLWTKETLKNDSYGIPCPLNQPEIKPEEISLLLVPALGIDRKGFRLGYGGGFFDRLRSKPNWRKIPALVVLPDICVSTNPLPKENWDIPFDGWISEMGYHQTN